MRETLQAEGADRQRPECETRLGLPKEMQKLKAWVSVFGEAGVHEGEGWRVTCQRPDTKGSTN